jgi:hypothetical protein
MFTWKIIPVVVTIVCLSVRPVEKLRGNALAVDT